MAFKSNIGYIAIGLQIGRKKMYIHRNLEKVILDTSKNFPVVMVTGPRQVGKTSILKSLSDESRTYVSLDSPRARQMAQEDPELFMQTYPPPVLIDEVQYAPNLFTYIKISIDKDRKPGMYWLTGSQQFHLMKNVTESLAGRIAVLKLLGMSLQEQMQQQLSNNPFIPDRSILKEKSKSTSMLPAPSIFEKIWRGGYPELVTKPEMNWEIFYDSYTQSYIQRDVKDLITVSEEASFVKFLRVTASLSGKMVNYSDLSKEIGISLNTVKSWLSILETSGIIYFLQPYYNNLVKRLVKTPKLYFLDTGLCCFLSGWSTPSVLEKGAMSGAMLETYVISEIIKSYWHNGKKEHLFYYRDKDKKEIDLIIEKDGILYPVEIKKTASPSIKATSNFSLLNKFNKKDVHGALICLSQEFLPLTRYVDIVPVSLV